MNWEQQTTTNPTNPIDPTGRIKEAYGSTLFLVISSMVSALTVLELIFTGNINVFYVLTVIGMWMAYSAARKPVFDSNNKGWTMISGTARATKIIVRISAIILIICAIALIALSAVAIPFLQENDKMITVDDINGYIEREMEFTTEEQMAVDVLLRQMLGSAAYSAAALVKTVLVILTALMLLTGVVLLVMSFTFYKTWHRFCKSVCENVKRGAPIEKANSLKVWLLVLAVFGAINVLSQLSFSGLILTGLYIVGYVWIKKYFCDYVETQQNTYYQETQF